MDVTVRIEFDALKELTQFLVARQEREVRQQKEIDSLTEQVASLSQRLQQSGAHLSDAQNK